MVHAFWDRSCFGGEYVRMCGLRRGSGSVRKAVAATDTGNVSRIQAQLKMH